MNTESPAAAAGHNMREARPDPKLSSQPSKSVPPVGVHAPNSATAVSASPDGRSADPLVSNWYTPGCGATNWNHTPGPVSVSVQPKMLPVSKPVAAIVLPWYEPAPRIGNAPVQSSLAGG